MEKEDYYKILRVSVDASPEEIRKVFREQFREWTHRLNAASLDRRQQAEKMLEKLKIIEETLLDEEKRKQYNRELKKTQERGVTHKIENLRIPPGPKEYEKVKKTSFFARLSKWTRWVIGISAVLLVALICVIGWYLFHTIYTPSNAPYKVLFYNENGELAYKGFWFEWQFYKYLDEHRVKENSLRGLIQRSSAFYHQKDGKGEYFEVESASVKNFDKQNGLNEHDEKVSSVQTHSRGNYTLIYENKHGEGAVLALPNTGYLYNLYDIPMGNGKTWNNKASSARVLRMTSDEWSLYVESSAPYQVLFYDENGKLNYEMFQTNSAFNQYIAEHPVKAKSSSTITENASTFYQDIDGRGWNFSVAPGQLINFDEYDFVYNENISSVRTHPYGDYTYIYENKNGEGSVLALANTGDLYNLSKFGMANGESWDDQASSVVVRSNKSN